MRKSGDSILSRIDLPGSETDMRKRAMRKKMSVKDRTFLEGLFEGKEITQAAIESGYPEEAAGRIGQEKIKDPMFLAAYLEELEKRGWDAEAIADEITRWLNATKRVRVGPGGTLIEDEGERKSKEAEIRFIDTTLEILGF